MNVNKIRAARCFVLDERDLRHSRAETDAAKRLRRLGWKIMERMDLGPTTIIVLTSPEGTKEA